MRILIVGNDANAYTLARMFSIDMGVDVVFAAPGNRYIGEFAECIDIADDDIEELLDFVSANEISLTVVTSLKAINSDIGGSFQKTGRNIFAPSFDAAYPVLYKSSCKKLLYKLKIPTVRFGIFDRENIALNYVSDKRVPVVITSDTGAEYENRVLARSFSEAKNVMENLFIQPESRVVIEDYTDANPVSLYFITDGFSARLLGSCSCGKNSSFSVFSPDNVLTSEIIRKINETVVLPYLEYCSSNNSNYTGILGIDAVVQGDEFRILGLNPFFKEMHLQSILPLLKTNFSELMLSVAVGSFSDEYSYIDISDKCVCSEISSNRMLKKNVSLYDDENFYYTYTNGGKVILSQIAKTYSRAKTNCESAIMYLSSRDNSETEVCDEKIAL